MIYTSYMINRLLQTSDDGGWIRRLLRRGMGLTACVLLALVSIVGVGAQPADSTAQVGVQAGRQAKNIAVITIDRMIDATMARSVKRRLDDAIKGGADAIVFELNTPGGHVGAVLEICEMIKRCPVKNTVAWVNSKAYSGGAFIALACHEIVVSDIARLGDAAPIQVTTNNELQSMSETERQKMLAPLLTELTDSARRNKYDEKLLQGMVSLGVELWLVENLQTGQRLFIDVNEHRLLFGEPAANEPLSFMSAVTVPSGAAGSAPPAPTGTGPIAVPSPQGSKDFVPASPNLTGELARAVSAGQDLQSTRPVLTDADKGKWKKIEKVSDGKGLFTFTESQMLRYGIGVKSVKSDEELRAFFGATNSVRLNQTWSESLVIFLTQPIVMGILIVIFLVSFFIEMTHPGLIVPGAVAALALVTLIVPPFLNNMASWWEIVAILGGIVLIAMEIFVLPGFGIAGVTGLLLLLFGLVGLFVGQSGTLFPDQPRGQSDLFTGVTTIMFSLTTAGVLMYFFAKHFGSIPFLGRLVLTTDRGEDDDAGLLSAMDAHDGAGVGIGEKGVAITPLRPTGRVQIGDRIHDVVSDIGFIDAGAKVKVASINQFRITVELDRTA